MNDTELRSIPGYEGLYSVTVDGRVYSHGSKKFLKQGLNAKGYNHVTLRKNGQANCMRVHRLVLITYNRLPAEGEVGCHWDGNKLNNHLSNLRWATHKENTEDQFRLGRQAIGERHGRSKLTQEQVIEIKKILKKKSLSSYKLADIYGVHNSLITKINTGKIWTHL